MKIRTQQSSPTTNPTPPKTQQAMTVPITIPKDTAAGIYAIRATQGGLSWCSQPVEVRA